MINYSISNQFCNVTQEKPLKQKVVFIEKFKYGSITFNEFYASRESLFLRNATFKNFRITKYVKSFKKHFQSPSLNKKSRKLNARKISHKHFYIATAFIHPFIPENCGGGAIEFSAFFSRRKKNRNFLLLPSFFPNDVT